MGRKRGREGEKANRISGVSQCEICGNLVGGSKVTL